MLYEKADVVCLFLLFNQNFMTISHIILSCIVLYFGDIKFYILGISNFDNCFVHSFKKKNTIKIFIKIKLLLLIITVTSTYKICLCEMLLAMDDRGIYPCLRYLHTVSFA